MRHWNAITDTEAVRNTTADEVDDACPHATFLKIFIEIPKA
jgi:hypothetical protein